MAVTNKTPLPVREGPGEGKSLTASSKLPPAPAKRRTGKIVVASIIVGLLIGWLWTAGELGFQPGGGNEIEFGNIVKMGPPVAKGPPPKVVVAETEFDFGVGEIGKVAHHDFIFKNEGRGPLELVKGDSSCTCTVGELEKPTVPPGESTHVTVEWHPRNHGPFRNTVQILTNDKSQPKIELAVSGEIRSSYQVSPETLTFTGINPTEPSSATARVYSYIAEDLKILEPQLASQSAARFFDLAVEPMPAKEVKGESGAKSGSLLKVTIKPGLPAGKFNQTIRFRLNLPDKPEVELPIEGDVLSPIEVVGKDWDAEHGILMLGPISTQDGAEARMFLIVRGEARKRVHFGVHDTNSETLKVTIGKPIDSDGVTRVPLTIVIPKGARQTDHLGNQRGKLDQVLIDTGLEESKQLSLRVRYAVIE